MVVTPLSDSWSPDPPTLQLDSLARPLFDFLDAATPGASTPFMTKESLTIIEA
jgi:hypothetical protein